MTVLDYLACYLFIGRSTGTWNECTVETAEHPHRQLACFTRDKNLQLVFKPSKGCTTTMDEFFEMKVVDVCPSMNTNNLGLFV